jgi:hypothetical protein
MNHNSDNQAHDDHASNGNGNWNGQEQPAVVDAARSAAEDPMNAVRRLLFGQQMQDLQQIIGESRQVLANEVNQLRIANDRRSDEMGEDYRREFREVRQAAESYAGEVKTRFEQHEKRLQDIDQKIIQLEQRTQQRTEALVKSAAQALASFQQTVNSALQTMHGSLLSTAPSAQHSQESQQHGHQG